MGRSRRAAWLERVGLALILAGGTAVRVARPELGRVQYDEADAASLVAAWQLDGHFPIAGTIGSTGLANPPGWPFALAVGQVLEKGCDRLVVGLKFLGQVTDELRFGHT